MSEYFAANRRADVIIDSQHQKDLLQPAQKGLNKNDYIVLDK